MNKKLIKEKSQIFNPDSYIVNADEKEKVKSLLLKYYLPKRQELMTREITQQEYDDIPEWEITDESLDEIEFLVTHYKSYGSEDKVVKQILTDTRFKQNTDLCIVALKTCLIDSTNSTNLSKHKDNADLYKIAKHIIDLKIDSKIENGSIDIVEAIAKVDNNKKLWSFASKYVVYHNFYTYSKDNFVIYDKIVKENLRRYIDKNLPKNYFAKMVEEQPDGYKKF